MFSLSRSTFPQLGHAAARAFSTSSQVCIMFGKFGFVDVPFYPRSMITLFCPASLAPVSFMKDGTT